MWRIGFLIIALYLLIQKSTPGGITLEPTAWIEFLSVAIYVLTQRRSQKYVMRIEFQQAYPSTKFKYMWRTQFQKHRRIHQENSNMLVDWTRSQIYDADWVPKIIALYESIKSTYAIIYYEGNGLSSWPLRIDSTHRMKLPPSLYSQSHKQGNESSSDADS